MKQDWCQYDIKEIERKLTTTHYGKLIPANQFFKKHVDSNKHDLLSVMQRNAERIISAMYLPLTAQTECIYGRFN